MKKYLYALFIMFISGIVLKPYIARANGAAGGELVYEWLSDSTYRFSFKYYHDCTAGAAPVTLPLCFNNTCNSSSFTITMGLSQTIAAPLTNSCGYKTKCDSPASTILAYTTVWYQATVTMPAQCSEWRMFTYVSGRSNAVNLQNATLTDMYVEATMNNVGSLQGNNSPYYTVNAMVYPCVINRYTYNAGAVDVDGDSLVTEVIRPRTGVASCSNTPIDVPFVITSPAYNISGNPIQTNNSFSLIPGTGKLEMFPTLAGTSTLTLRTKEYRSGVLIGSVMREMPVNVMACNPPPITASFPCQSGISINPVNFNTVGCVTVPFTFCLEVVSTDTNAKIFLSDDHLVSIPQAIVSVAGQNTDTAVMTISWAPGVNDGGNRTLGFTITDNSCYYPGFPTVNTFHLPMYITPATTININDTVICESQPIKLSVTGGGNFKWERITAVDTTIIWGPLFTDTPVISAKYVVTSNQTSYCPLHKDSVDVMVLPVKNPVISIHAMPDTVIGQGQTVTFGITNTDCNNAIYRWQLNGVDIPGADSSTWESNTLNDMDMVQCKMVCNDTCATDTVSNGITIHVTNSVHDVNGISNIELYPNPNNGFFIMKGYASKAESIKLSIVNAIGQVLYGESYDVHTGAFSKEINLQHLPDGIYILKLEQKGKLEVKQFRVNH